MRERVTVLSLSVSQSVILSHNRKGISKMAASQRLKQASKCCTGHFKSPLMCQNFRFNLFFQKKLVIFRFYECKRWLVTPLPSPAPLPRPHSHLYERNHIISLLPAVVLHYTIFSAVYRSAWSFTLKLLVR